MPDTAKYCVWINSKDNIGSVAGSIPEVTVGSDDNNKAVAISWGKYNVSFPQLPKFEKFLLKLESFVLAEHTTAAALPQAIDPTTGVEPVAAVAPATGNIDLTIEQDTAKLYVRGFNTQSSVEIGGTNVVDPQFINRNGVPQPAIILSTLDFSNFSVVGGGNVVRPAHVPVTVIDRPNQNNTIEIKIQSLGGNILVAEELSVDAAGTVTKPIIALGAWTACLSLTPLTNNDLHNWDGRA